MSDLNAVIARWDKFLATSYERFRDILAEAEAGCAQLLAEADHDTQAFSNAWGAMEMRCKNLSMKVSDTWNDKVCDLFDEADAPAEIEHREQQKGLDLEERMAVELEGMRIKVFADAARAVWQRALQEAPESLSCSQCAAPMQVPGTLSAVNVSCPHCSAVVTYEPGMRLRSIEHFCVHPLCEEVAWPQWLARHQAEKARHDARDETLDLLKAHEKAYIEYLQAYLGMRARLLPHLAGEYDKDLRGRMQQFYQDMDREAAWTMAGSPRAIP